MVALLSGCPGRNIGNEIFAGHDLLSLKELFRFAGALIARGCFLPSAVKDQNQCYRALWLPVLAPADIERLNRIENLIPPVALQRADRREAISALLDSMADAVVRLSVTTTLSRAQALKGKFYSVHDAWLAALRGDSPVIRWPESDELAELSGVLHSWRRPVDFAREANITLLFELFEPTDPEKKEWNLKLSYRQNGRVFHFPQTGKFFTDAELSEYLLMSLGQATLLFLPLERLQIEGRESAVRLTRQEAHTFINQTAALLRAAGYEIILPQWCDRERLQPFALNVEILAHSQRDQRNKTLDAKFDIQWSVTLEGEPVTPEELEDLLNGHSPLVYFRGRWIEIDLSQLQEALRIWKRKRRETCSAREIMQLALSGSRKLSNMEINDLHGQGWIANFLKTLRGEKTFRRITQPAELKGRLRPYQKRGLSWLVFLSDWGLGACLADDMGLGKTIQAIAFMLHLKKQGSSKPVLIAGPTSILGNWMHELNRFAPNLKCMLHHGLRRRKDERLMEEVRYCDVLITSYTLLYRDYHTLKRIKWSLFVADEAQNIKNAATRQAQVARAIQADHRVALTGTPMENNVGDIWSLMDFLNPGLLGTRQAFRDNFFKPIQSGSDPRAKNRLRKVTSPFILRRLKTDKEIIRDLPEKFENKVYCSLSIEQRQLYQEITESFNRELDELSGIKRCGAVLAVLTALKQVCNHPANYLGRSDVLADRSGKLERLVEMLDEVFQMGESALIFTQYAQMGALLQEHLCGTFAVDMPFLYGGSSRQARERMIDGFQKSKEPTAFILSLKAGGTGLNLTRANHVFHFDRWWNPAVENQATDRAFRIGQKKNVMVHKFICAGTLEERIDALMSSKLILSDEIVGSGEKFLTELSNNKLRQLLQLSCAQSGEN